MELPAAEARRTSEHNLQDDVHEVRVGCESCGALLSVGIPGSHPADTPVIVRCGNCRRLLEVQLTMPAQLPDQLAYGQRYNFRLPQQQQQQQQQQSQKWRQQLRQQQLLAQNQLQNPYLQQAGLTRNHLTQRAPSFQTASEGPSRSLLGGMGGVTPADLTRFAHQSVAAQEQRQQQLLLQNTLLQPQQQLQRWGQQGRLPGGQTLQQPSWAGTQRLPNPGPSLKLGSFSENSSQQTFLQHRLPQQQQQQQQQQLHFNPQYYAGGAAGALQTLQNKRTRAEEDAADIERRVMSRFGVEASFLRDPSQGIAKQQDPRMLHPTEIVRRAEEQASRELQANPSAHTGIDLEPRNGVGLDFMTHQIGGGGSGGQEPAMTQQPEAPAAENGPSGGHNQWDLAGASEKPPVQGIGVSGHHENALPQGSEAWLSEPGPSAPAGAEKPSNSQHWIQADAADAQRAKEEAVRDNGKAPAGDDSVQPQQGEGEKVREDSPASPPGSPLGAAILQHLEMADPAVLQEHAGFQDDTYAIPPAQLAKQDAPDASQPEENGRGLEAAAGS